MPTKTCALVERLQTIADPRRQGENLKHPLVNVIIVGFCGVLAGCEDFVEIAEWAKGNEEFFRTFLELPHGIASHDTFNRVFAMLKPTTLLVFITTIIGSFQVFTQVFVMTNGGPGYASRVVSLEIYQTAFINLKMGLASAMAMVLFGVVFGLTMLQLKVGRDNVEY